MKLFKYIFISVVISSVGALAMIMRSCNKALPVGKSVYTITGRIETDVWNNVKWYNVSGEICGHEWDGLTDYSVCWKSLYDKDSLYFLFKVLDDKLVKNRDPIVPFWENDMIEVFFTQDRKFQSPKNTHFAFCYGVDSVITSSKGGPRSISCTTKNSEGGYIMGVAIPWEEIGIDPLRKKSIYCNIEASDCDKVSEEDGVYFGRETVVSWSPNSCNVSVKASNCFGTLVFK